jgi:predicted RND superfamily exporter protein
MEYLILFAILTTMFFSVVFGIGLAVILLIVIFKKYLKGVSKNVPFPCRRKHQ